MLHSCSSKIVIYGLAGILHPALSGLTQGGWRGGTVLPKAQPCPAKPFIGEESMDPSPQGQLRWFFLCAFKAFVSV